MEEELNYVTVTFRRNAPPAHEEPNNLERVNEEVKMKEQTRDAHPVITENKKKPPLYSPLALVVAGLGVVCVILLSVVIALNIHSTCEQRRENATLTAQNLQLRTEKTALERQMEELIRERDRLNWTIGVILDFDSFPVNTWCPQRACKPCLDNWVHFQSSCYLFLKYQYYSNWKSWKESHEYCRQMKADLVVIGSREEQEFINNHTEAYRDEQHGYWIGLNKMSSVGSWSWVDGSNFTMMYWITQQAGYSVSCALTLPHAKPLANWHKASCTMKNRWICETRALIRAD